MPFDVAEPSQVQSENDTSQGVPVEKAAILLVDDNSVNLDIESEILGTYGLQVDTADSGSKAIEYCHSHSPDMIILDLHMPDMDGYISKPFRPDDLRKMIYKHLHIRREMPEITVEQGDEVFDCVACLDALGGSKSILFDIIKRFISDHGSDQRYICQHIEVGSYMNARIILHDVMGLSGNLCCRRLHESAKNLSDTLKTDTPQNADTKDFEEQWQKAVSRLEGFLQLNDDSRSQNADSRENSQLVKGLLDRCKAFDISAAEYFQQHRAEFKECMEKTKFRQLEEYINRYDLLSITQSEDLWR